MRVESLSIRGVTVAIFVMIGIVASVLSLLAGSYFRQAALDAQVNSLSRVIEVATQEMLKAVRGHAFDLGMRLAHSEDIMDALRMMDQPGGREVLVALLDDPFINGFVGFANINLEKIRVYDLDLNLLAESSRGMKNLPLHLASSLVRDITGRSEVDRLKALDALWIAPQTPLHSTLVPIGGLHQIGYLEVIVNPVFNLPNIGAITRTPVSIFTPTGNAILAYDTASATGHLPVEYMLYANDGTPAFKIVGYEDVGTLEAAMEKTRLVTTTGFLLLTFGTLLFALWLFNRFLFRPLAQLVSDMRQMASGKLDLSVNQSGLRDFSVLAGAFNALAQQVRQRTGDLERLLDLDDSAILCFGKHHEAVYLNRGATALFGYTPDEVGELDFGDLFDIDLAGLMRDAAASGWTKGDELRTRLVCIRRDGGHFGRDAVIRSLDAGDSEGWVIVLPPATIATEPLDTETVVSSVQRHEQRMNAVEESLNTLLAMARNAPGFMSPATGIDIADVDSPEADTARSAIREQTVNLMLCALACWEHDLGKSKLDLAEESRIWPVYIDKSTPTTRTLDKYLNLESCPRNPRTQRVIDTAEFVLRQSTRKSSDERHALQQALTNFRLTISGTRPGN